jgi:GH25 family lysozyme M1 (1,4-beta-N-acetylmuramidase)
MLQGVDVSSSNVEYDSNGLYFVFVKATEGHTYVSPDQAKQAQQARNSGCVVGFYHFLWPGDIVAQAQYFVTKTDSVAGDLLAVDWEPTSSKTFASNAEKDQFLKEVQKLRPQHRVLLYCDRDFWLNHDTTSYAGDGLWIADRTTEGKPQVQAK